MGKIIIDNRSKLTDLEAMRFAMETMERGRISNNGKQYCYAVVGEVHGHKVAIYSFLNDKSDRFVITNVNK